MPLQIPTKHCRVAEGRLQVLQIYRLLQCVREADTEQIKNLVKLGVENLINLCEPKDGTGALHVAVSAKNQDLVSFLLSQGADPNIQDRTGVTPLMLAAQLGSDSILALLTQNQADLKIQDTEGKGVLFYCLYPTKRHTRCLQVALKSQADVNNVSARGVHVFQLMCEKVQQCVSMCLIMLESGADPSATNQLTGVTALMEAAKAGSLQLVRAILKKGGNPNAVDHKRYAAVHYAALGGYFEVIQVLSAFSADLGVFNLDACTPLHFAAATGNANCCKFLAQRGCNPKLKNQEGFLPRQIAKDAGHKAASRELRKAERQQGKGNKSNNITLLSGLWPLTLHDWSHEFEAELRRAFGGKFETVSTEMFVAVLQKLNAPADVDQLQTVILAHDKRKASSINVNEFMRGVKYIKKPFLLSSYLPKKKKVSKSGKASKKKKKKKDKLLLPLPICTLTQELMPRRQDGGPPDFMIETYYNCSDSRRFDREHPPEHPIVNDSGWYVEKPHKIFVNVNYCVKSGDLESLDLAFNHGVPVDVKDEFYKTPLMVACSNGNYEVAQYLLNRGADVNSCDQFSWTPLHHAAHAGQLELIRLLLEAGAAVDAKALSGGTPLMRAIQSSRPACVNLLIKSGASVVEENKKEQNCLDIARVFGDSRVIHLVKEKMDSLPKPKENSRGNRSKLQITKPSKEKAVTAAPAAGIINAESSTTTTGKTPVKDPTSIILQNTRITTGKTNVAETTFVPKTVWGKPPTTSQLLSKIERRKELLSLEIDFDDFMMPYSKNTQRTALELAKSTE